jgi:hypothetical protein
MATKLAMTGPERLCATQPRFAPRHRNPGYGALTEHPTTISPQLVRTKPRLSCERGTHRPGQPVPDRASQNDAIRVSQFAGTEAFAARGRSASRGQAWDARHGRSQHGLSGRLIRSAASADCRICPGW